jgi:putative membrane protein
MVYLWTKSLHLLFVIAWMATVFYLPRILVNLAEAGDIAPVRERLQLMGKRLYKFGHNMFGIAVTLGLLLWLGHKFWPTAYPDVVAGGRWMHAKLGLVAVMLLYFILAGRMLKRSIAGEDLPSSKRLRLFNELPVFVVLAIIYLVLAKPF